MKVLQINTVVNAGSTGRIAESLGVKVLEAGGESHIAYGRNPRPSRSHTFRMGSQGSIWWHGIQTRLLDRHGEGSRVATRELVRYMEELCPDVIHLHNLHGYYLNLEILLKQRTCTSGTEILKRSRASRWIFPRMRSRR